MFLSNSAAPPRKFHASKLIRQILALSLGTLLIVQVPAQVSRSSGTIQVRTSGATLSTGEQKQLQMEMPYTNVAEMKAKKDESLVPAKAPLPQPALKPSALCGHKDKACKEQLKNKKAENIHQPSGNREAQIAVTDTTSVPRAKGA
jgi:hypothetical protein